VRWCRHPLSARSARQGRPDPISRFAP
jgi:hypothetical protein